MRRTYTCASGSAATLAAVPTLVRSSGRIVTGRHGAAVLLRYTVVSTVQASPVEARSVSPHARQAQPRVQSSAQFLAQMSL